MIKFDQLENKSPRLRKKLYLGEFAVYGFRFSCHLQGLTGDQYGEFLDSLIAWGEARDLCVIAGCSTDSCDGIVVPEARYGSPSEQDRTDLQAFLAATAAVQNENVEPLKDAYYGDFDEA